MRITAWIGGAAASMLVGASFPISEALTDYPYAAGQMIRYAAGALILTALLKGRLGRPTVKEFVLLSLVAAIGMAGFNLAVLGAVEHMGATNTGVIIGASPVLLALAGRTRDRRILTAAAVVVAGAAIVNGADSRISAIGTLIAVAALFCEVGFTLLAAPLLPRLGPKRVAAWAAWLATAQLLILTRGDIPTPTTDQTAAIAYLAVITTALAFVLWFSAVQTLGAGRTGLLVGLMPVAAVAVDATLNGRAPSTADLAGTALVAAGVVVGALPARCRNPQCGPPNVGHRSDDARPPARETAVQVIEGESGFFERRYRARAAVRGRDAARLSVQASRRRAGAQGRAQASAEERA